MLVTEPAPRVEVADPLLLALNHARREGRLVLGLFSDAEGFRLAVRDEHAGVTETGLGRGPYYRPSRHGFPSWWGWERALTDCWREPPWVMAAGGRGTHVMPLGPVRADVAEALRYEMTVLGDEIHHVRLVAGYKRRHTEERIASLPWQQAVEVAERVTGTSPVAHALAYSLAVETVLGAMVPAAADRLRTLVAELERVTSHVGDLAVLAASTGTIAAAADLYRLKEQVLRFNFALTGHRYLRGVVGPGGVRRQASATDQDLRTFVTRFEQEFAAVIQRLDGTNSFLDRLYGAGRLSDDALGRLDLTGFVAKSADIGWDLRFDAPYAAYAAVTDGQRAVRMAQPDAYGRYRVRVEEILQSLRFIRRLGVPSLAEGALQSDVPAGGAGVGYGLVEAPRGRLVYRVEVAKGHVVRAGIRTPSALNWAAVPMALAAHNIMQDFPIIDASFGLAVASLDL
jgi:formate hydrogenlyase subunit 5